MRVKRRHLGSKEGCVGKLEPAWFQRDRAEEKSHTPLAIQIEGKAILELVCREPGDANAEATRQGEIQQVCCGRRKGRKRKKKKEMKKKKKK